MLSEALRRLEVRAGAQFPDLPPTLRHALVRCTQPGVDKASLIAAIECDPTLLLALMTASAAPVATLSAWHDELDGPTLKALLILCLSRKVDTPDADVTLSQLERSLLAAELAVAMDVGSRHEIRLVNLLADTAGSEDGSLHDHLRALGASRVTLDALHYRSTPFDELAGTWPVLRITAACERLFAATDASTSDDIARGNRLQGDDLDAIARLLVLSPEALLAAEASATQRLSALRAEFAESAGVIEDNDSLIADALTGAVVYKTIIADTGTPRIDSRLTRMARFTLGAHGALYFIIEANTLVADSGGRSLLIAADSKESLIAQCQHRRHVTIAANNELNLVVERQVLAELGGQHLVCVPHEDSGVLVLATDWPRMARRGVLLSAFAEAAADAVRRQRRDAAAVVDVADVERTASEIIHEVNNPLAIIQNYLGTLSANMQQTEETSLAFAAIDRELVRVSSIVGRYGTTDSTPSLSWQVVALNELIEDVLLIVRQGSPGILFETNYDPDVPALELAADAIRQVVMNIAKNAVEALSGQTDAMIILTTEGAVNVNGDPFLEITIADNGHGLTQSARLALFRQDVDSNKGAGHGLGLGIVHRLLQSMGGSISVRSRRAGGAEFRVLIPVGRHETADPI